MTIRRSTAIVAVLLLAMSAVPLRAKEQDVTGKERKEGSPYAERFERHYLFGVRLKDPRSFEIEMAWIPPGTLRSRDATGRVVESRVSGFWMSKHEVTADLFYEWYDAFRSKDFHETPQPELAESRFKELSSPPKLFMMPDPVRGNEPPGDVPATGLTQYGAQEFCRWFSLRSGRPYRLPTEVEWEYAARAGTTTDWHFGNERSKLGEYAWFGEKFADGSHQVGKKRPNAWGLFDMYGNASEWVLDGWSDEFGRQFKSGEADPWVRRKAGQQAGVIRGGDWTSPAAGTRSASRRRRDDTGGRSWHYGWQWYDFSEEGRRIGFRLVSPAKPESDGRESYLRPVADEVPEKR